MNEQETREAVLRWLTRPQYNPVKASVLAQQIGLLKEDFADFRKLIKKMRREGWITFGAGHIIYPVKEALVRSGQIVGYFKRHADGYGFVRETELHPNAENISEPPDDIYIPPGKAMDAASGDFVAVTLDRNSSRHRRGGGRGRSGSIERVIERAKHHFVGTFHDRNGDGWVEVDGKIFSDPIHVGDPTANRVQEGDKVVIEMLRFPCAWRAGEAVITEILGPRGDVRAETLAVMHQFDLPEKFEEPVLVEARHQVEEFQKKESAGLMAEEGRRDLTDWYTITIDPADARDFDDAISIQAQPNGNMRLGVHIADVSYFVQPDTLMDREAFRRGNSTYLPDRVIPMLPEVLSNGLASLQPHTPRLTKSVLQDYAPNGLCVDIELCDSIIQSDYRLNYEQVDLFFTQEDAGETNTELPPEVQESLRQFRALAKILRGRRHSRGMLVMNLPEIRLDLDADGNVVGVRREENTESHQMIEEFMVSANEAVAQTLVDAESNLMRRVHKPPTLAKLDALGDFLDEIGLRMESSADRFEIQKVLEKTAGTEKESAVHQAVLRAMQRAEYSPEEEGHYALASECYCHFTSPIRRYADLTIHRQVENHIQGKSPKRNFRKIYDEGKHLSYCEQNSEEAERELTRIKMLKFFSSRGELELDATVVNVTRYGLFVQCKDYPLEGLLPLAALPDDEYHYEPHAYRLSGYHAENQFQLGDKIRVKIVLIDTDRRDIRFELAGVEKKIRKTARPDASVPSVSGVLSYEKVVNAGKKLKLKGKKKLVKSPKSRAKRKRKH
ncbi:MAG: VacB/RNase II family 3'-5' exoribonuclease [Planctomycetia bacterium]|nr:VacB/RNase II family 3'-5' exoribonuclease [Planctomycetia bacterium]